jgi:CBS domain containing-hemolysin-like protein
MFKDLDWRSAARRSAVVIGIYVALFYVLSGVFPKQFGLQDRAQIVALIVNAVIFFLVFTFVYALVERSRKRRLAEMSKRSKQAKPAPDGSEAGQLKGRPNPNTSRKKARRRR